MTKAIEELLSAAERTWGTHPMDWPDTPHYRPRWWQFRAKRLLREMEQVFGPIDDAAMLRFWRERRKGQSAYEDAGGYLERCYIAMLGGDVQEPLTYADAADALLRGEPL